MNLVGKCSLSFAAITVLTLLICSDGYRFADHYESLSENGNDHGVPIPLNLVDGDQPATTKESMVSSTAGTTLLADIPPPVSSNVLLKWAWTDDVLDRYWLSNDGFETEEGNHLTYGEVTPLGVRQLVHQMEGNGPDEAHGEAGPSVFYDLGSGVGRLVVQLALDSSTFVTPERDSTTGFVFEKVVGVELSQKRHDIAVDSLARFQESWCVDETYLTDMGDVVPASCASRYHFPDIKLIHGDVLEVNLADATHVYISSLCFPSVILEQLVERLLTFPKLTVVAALNQLDAFEKRPDEWDRWEANIQMSWGAGLAKLYRRREQLR